MPVLGQPYGIAGCLCGEHRVKYSSTRSSDDARKLTLDEALMRGIADDGGLFVPDELPAFDVDDFSASRSIGDTAKILLMPFFSGSSLAPMVDEIIAETLHFPIPVSKLDVGDGNAWMLELYHGPTAAFKDVGAGFLAACLSRLHDSAEAPLTILVATSGDTGGAVAAAFNGKPNIRVVVLFPNGRVSERQQKQLTCWGDNVLSLAVEGSFDDCQAMVKEAFAASKLREKYRLSSANSINIGRLLPQSTYYAHASLEHFRATGHRPGFIIPVGNMGNSLACILARDMGLPIGEIVLASNANRLIPDYLAGADWEARASIQTLASAMDVGNPSNMERLRNIHGDAEKLGGILSAVSVNDEKIEQQIVKDKADLGFATCPHTATATYAYSHLSPKQKMDDWILVATAHPAKFESIVEPLIGDKVPVPSELSAILSRTSHFHVIQPGLDALSAALQENFPVDASGYTSDK
jgi:threonine synthase